jgi:hypothetical protein
MFTCVHKTIGHCPLRTHELLSDNNLHQFTDATAVNVILLVPTRGAAHLNLYAMLVAHGL